MKIIPLVTLAFLTGCQIAYPTATLYVLPGAQQQSALPPGVPAATPIYAIDNGVAANVPYGAYGITTNGTTWYLEWQSDGAPHTFTGDIYCADGNELAFIQFYGSLPADTFHLISPNHFHFDDSTPAKVHQHLEFDWPFQPMADAPPQAVAFDLKIDGIAATNPSTTFPSSHQLATVDTMPFSLIPSGPNASR